MKEFRLIVAGSRVFSDEYLLNKKLKRLIYLLEKFLQVKVIILHGGAYGADTLADLYALHNKIPVEPYLADWPLYGKSAGMRRNAVMAGKGDYLIAFWDGQSKGTSHMIECMRKLGKPVMIVRFTAPSPLTLSEYKKTISHKYAELPRHALVEDEQTTLRRWFGDKKEGR